MASILNLANCGTTGNTGVAKCGVYPGVFQYALFIPKGFVIPASETESVTTTMLYVQSKLEADSVADRWYKSVLLTNFNDKTGAIKEQDRDINSITTWESTWYLQYQMNGTICDYQNALNTFKRKQAFFDVIMVDQNNILYGRQATDADGAMGTGGFTMFETYVEQWKATTVSTTAAYFLNLKFANIADYTSNLAILDCSSATEQVANMVGLVGVNLVHGATANTSSAIYVQAFEGCGAANLGDYYGTTLNDDALWTVTSPTGTPRTLTTVTYNSTTKTFVIASSSAFVAGDIVKLAAPSVLIAASPSLNLVTPTGYTVAI